MTALHEQTECPCATSAAEVTELQPSETQTSETLPVVTRKKSKYWNYILGIRYTMYRKFLEFLQLETFTLDSVSPCHLKGSLTC